MITHTDPHTGEIKPGHYLRTAYNYDIDEASKETGLACPEETMAQQHFKEECDINTIVERFGITGELPQNVRVPLPDEFIGAMDYQQAMNAIIDGQNAFAQMPANVRARFQNDPQEFLQFVHDPENRAEAERLGIINAPKATPAPVQQTPAAAPVAASPTAA